MNILVAALCAMSLLIGSACSSGKDDLDDDGLANAVDNCPNVYNPGQLNLDGDSFGDVCDDIVDSDADGFSDVSDNCPADYNPDQNSLSGYILLAGEVCDDEDADGIVDGSDNCPVNSNHEQTDTDGNGTGDACEGCQRIAPASDSSLYGMPGDIVETNGRLYFTADFEGKENLWVYEPVDRTYRPLLDSDSGVADAFILSLSADEKNVYMVVCESGICDLWIYQISTSVLLQATQFDSSVEEYGGIGSLYIAQDRVIFIAADDAHGEELWTYSSDTGASLLADVIPGSDSGYPVILAGLGNQLYFTMWIDGKRQLWLLDIDSGSAQFTGIFPGGFSSFRLVGDTVYIGGNTGSGENELWSFNPDVGAILVADINPVGGSDPMGLLWVGDSLFFAANNGISSELWVYEPTIGARQISSFGPHTSGASANMIAIDGTVYLNATDAEHGQELWAYDETNGTHLVLEIIPGTIGTYLLHMTEANGQLIFSANDNIHGNEPWVYDPATGVGTMFDVYTGTRGSYPGEFRVIDNKVFFSARGLVLGDALFVYDSGCVPQ